jgi:diguanylate cyclase (GGDEF)-like protein
VITHFDANSVMATGGLICFIMALILLGQARNMHGYRSILSSLAACLIGGTTALLLVVSDSGYNTPWRNNLANFIGTLVYFFALYCFVGLYRPDIGKKGQLILAAVWLFGFVLTLDPRMCYIWNQISRIAVLLYIFAVVVSGKDDDAPGLRWFSVLLPLACAVGMAPQLASLYQMPSDAVIQLADPQSSAAMIQAVFWAMSPALVYALITSIIYARISQRLRSMANEDVLTGVSSRRSLIEQGTQVLQRSKRSLPDSATSLLLIDVDHFKNINDKWGHLVGDAVLKHLVNCIKDVVRADDRVIGRYGGEEFCVILPNTPLSGAAVVAERLRKHIAVTPYRFENHLIQVTVSIGLALQETGATLDSMLGVADQRLYAAKQAGRNQVVSFSGFAAAAQ